MGGQKEEEGGCIVCEHVVGIWVMETGGRMRGAQEEPALMDRHVLMSFYEGGLIPVHDTLLRFSIIIFRYISVGCTVFTFTYISPGHSLQLIYSSLCGLKTLCCC